MKRLATICARAGSKGIKGKNTKHLNGKPLICYSIDQARASESFSAIAVTSDSSDILSLSKRYGVDYTINRPSDLASDVAPKIPSIRHCLEAVELESGQTYNTIVDLDITSPLRSVEDIKGAIDLLERGGADNVVSGAPSRRSPYFNLVEEDEMGRVSLSKEPQSDISRRQDSPTCFDLNASVFVWSRSALFSGNNKVIGNNTRLYVMPVERSVDIDSELDFRFVEYLMTMKASTTDE
ncbi:MAG: acylneuraminate cytidylyltransferase family protein [Pseudomonadota bacterium]|nr:acylneuraminate cytidylyltransferase family protein [Pseudomonadota bacterium]